MAPAHQEEARYGELSRPPERFGPFDARIVFGQAGQHARSAIGLAELPGNAAVEIEFIFALKRRGGSSQQQRRPSIKVIEKR